MHTSKPASDDGNDIQCGVLPRDAMLARYMLSLYVHLSICLSQVGVLSKRLNESSWVFAWEFLSTYHTLCCKEI